MLKKKNIFCVLLTIACISLFVSGSLYPADFTNPTELPFNSIEISNLTRYNEDRIAFQHVQLPGFTPKEDNSLSSLMIIKNSQIYLFRDGYDDIKKVQTEAYIQEIRKELPKDLWINKINSKPDYMRIADRRTEKLLNVTEEFVDKNFGDFYRSVRNSHINKYVQIFRGLMKDRVESGLQLARKPISPPAFQEVKEASKYSTTVSAKAIDDTLYFAEDSDGDNVTETFYVTFDDGFNWGFKSGPNILLIYNNKEDDIKQIMGKLCYEAYFGTSEEEKNILKTFPKDSEIINAFKLEKVTQQTLQAQPAAEKTTPATGSGTK